MKGKNLNIENLLNDSLDSDSSNLQNQRDKLKLAIMVKFNLSSSEAEKILLKMEKKKKNDNSKDGIHNSSLDKKIDYDQSQKLDPHLKNQLPKNSDNNNFKSDSVGEPQSNVKNMRNNEGNLLNSQKSKVDFVKCNYIHNEGNLNNDIVSQKSQHSGNVDSILEDIIPEYDKQISICVDHVDLTFEVQNEKVDTLKETFIRALKRNQAKTIKIHALKDISFKIYKGEKVGIIGYNGAGKSTLLNVITGIYPPDEGKVTTCGNISPLLSLGAGFDYNFSGRKNIILNGAVLGYDKEFLESKVNEIIEFSELGEFIDIPIKNYSSGMLAKLGFSVATAVNPDILIIDEILGVGDVNFIKKSRDKIKSLMDGGTTVLLVSHSIPQIRELCDKAIWIDNGHLKEMGEVNKVCDHYLKDAEKASNEQLQNIQFR